MYSTITKNDKSSDSLGINFTTQLTTEEIVEKLTFISNLKKGWTNNKGNTYSTVYKIVIKKCTKIAKHLIFVGDILPHSTSQIDFIYQTDLKHKIKFTFRSEYVLITADCPVVPNDCYNHYVKKIYYADKENPENNATLMIQACEFLNAVIIYYLDLKIKDYLDMIDERTVEIILNHECCAKISELVLKGAC